MKKILIVIFIGFALYSYFQKNSNIVQSFSSGQGTSSDQLLSSAFENRQSNLQVEGSGIVIRILPDDTDGSQHQKFILKLSSGQTLLIAHNIDIAPRINSLLEGDTVEFYGEYEWNPKGGVVHWTHHDPNGHHADGWLRHADNVYE